VALSLGYCSREGGEQGFLERWMKKERKEVFGGGGAAPYFHMNGEEEWALLVSGKGERRSEKFSREGVY